MTPGHRDGVPRPDDPALGLLFDRMVEVGHAEFTLTTTTANVPPLTDREVDLVRVAVAAGVVGALTVLRLDDPDDDLTDQPGA